MKFNIYIIPLAPKTSTARFSRGTSIIKPPAPAPSGTTAPLEPASPGPLINQGFIARM